MTLHKSILNKEETISIVGLGYVGMPIAVAFAKKANVIGYDLNAIKIDQYKNGFDPTNEVGDQAIKDTTVHFTNNESEIKKAKFHVVAVPTPINQDKTPNLNPVESSSRTVGRNLTKGSIVVYESTVYPGVTEDICIPILEEESGLKCGIDFEVGYSPERINPGDQVHRLENIVKIVSATSDEALEEIANIYEIVIEAGVHKASSIKVAEAAKVVENSQRDINIAFMNELAKVFDLMDIDTQSVVEAMNTKWNSLGFTPGLVGGHCIGVDPYYFVYEAEKLGYHSQIVLSGRQINDSMGSFISDAVVKKLIQANKKVKNSKVAIFGLTFKEDTPDTRNTRVIDIIENLKEYGIDVEIVDPVASPKEVMDEYGFALTELEDISELDGIVLTVAHEEFKNMSLTELDKFYKNVSNDEKVLIDVKSIFNSDDVGELGYKYWRL